MPDILDVFDGDGFGLVDLTAAVNKKPFVPGQIGALGIFDEAGVTSTTISVEELDGQLTLIGNTPRGGPGDTVAKEKRKLRSFMVDHFQRDDAIMADEVQGVRAFGSANERESVEAKISERFDRHSRSLDATLEHLRAGAIKGVVTNKSGTTLVNLFTEFSVTEPTAVPFELTANNTKVRQVCLDVIHVMEDALEAESYDGIHGFCGRNFWRRLIEHSAVKETYLNTVQAAELRGDPSVSRFEFGGITFERYRTGTKAAASNASGARFIADEDCRFVVRGVPGLFITRFAPADYVETVNTIGLPRYARQFVMENRKGVRLEVQSNPINLCTQPATLVRGTSGA